MKFLTQNSGLALIMMGAMLGAAYPNYSMEITPGAQQSSTIESVLCDDILITIPCYMLRNALINNEGTLASSTQDILNLGLTSKHFYSITHNQQLWNPYLFNLIEEAGEGITVLAPLLRSSLTSESPIRQALEKYLDTHHAHQPLADHPLSKAFFQKSPLAFTMDFFNLFTLLLYKQNYLSDEQKKIFFDRIKNFVGGPILDYNSQAHPLILLNFLFSQKKTKANPYFSSSDLIRAIETNQLEETNKILFENVDAALEKNDFGETALTAACRLGKFETAKIILAKTTKKEELIQQQDISGATALHCAVTIAHIPLIKLLLYHGASLNQGNQMRTTPFIIAVVFSHSDVLHCLLELLDGEKTSANKPNKTARYKKITPKKVIKWAKSKLSSSVPSGEEKGKKAILTHTDKLGFTALHWAAISGRIDNFELIFEQSKEYLDEIAPADQHNSPLACAAAFDQAPIVEFLLDQGKLITNKLTDIIHPFIIAAAQGAYKVVHLFLHKRSEYIQLEDKEEALIEACYGEHLPIIKLLIENGLQIKNLTYHDFNALNAASERGYAKLALYLVNQGYFTLQEVLDAAKIATKEGHVHLRKQLVEAVERQLFYRKNLYSTLRERIPKNVYFNDEVHKMLDSLFIKPTCPQPGDDDKFYAAWIKNHSSQDMKDFVENLLQRLTDQIIVDKKS